MKILYVSAEYLPTEIAISIRSRFNVSALCQRGHDVTVLTSGATRTGPDGEIVVGVGRQMSGNSASFSKRLLNEISLGVGFGWYLVRARKQYDKVIVTSPPFFALIIVFFFLWLLRLPYVVDVRDRYPMTLFSLNVLSSSSFAGHVLLKLERMIYERSQAVFTVTSVLRDGIQADTGVSVHLEQNGFDETIISGKSELEDRQGPVRIVQHGLFGRLVDEENVVKIANYCAEHGMEHEFILVGYGAKLESIAARNLPNVRVLPKQSQASISQILQTSDIGLASMVENENTLVGMPVKVFEYIGAGLPIIHSPIGVMGKDILENEFGLAFRNQDWETAAQWLVRMIGSPKMRKEYARNVVAARQRYSRQAQSANFAEIICALPR
ncbi:glycosyltransferase family 4 protein [Rhodovulum sulfidophilum]|uniref:glycosyltransferase family 4 protein n=1 Tax=Rhodovulum sulfidophilum TaxID=35806 RepID=UPI001389DB61|nr:glycosyltransferase family 4 protein [Rhodovulum sulfidophilum]NDK36736.1 glycosyltransferase family 4 protein [Rhodovulum sulfidophilum]